MFRHDTMKVTHVQINGDVGDIRVEVESKYRHFPVKVSVEMYGGDYLIKAKPLFQGYEEERERVKQFAMNHIAGAFL